MNPTIGLPPRHRSAGTRAAGAHAGRVLPVLLAASVALSLLWSAGARGQDRPDSFADLAEELLPAVVSISSQQLVAPNFEGVVPEGSPFERFFRQFEDSPGQPRPQYALGSGFVVDPDGIVVTNLHVIEGAEQVTVVLQDDTNLPATLIGSDARTDIAVLKVESETKLPFVGWGDSDDMRVGDWVVAIGNPFGLGGSVTAGIVSARSRDINAGPYDDFIQTDASINRGNSGGPMFNLDGEVIGINTAIFSPSGGSVGIGFAIPSNVSQAVVQQLTEFGRTRRGWLGVRIQTVDPDIAESFGLEAPAGALVAGVNETGPSHGVIEPGDVIITFNREPVAEMRDLPRLVASADVGLTVPVEVWRDGALVEVAVTLGELERAEELGQLNVPVPTVAAPADLEALDGLGLTLGTLTEERRSRLGIEEPVNGVVVLEVAPGSVAEAELISAGDVILEVGQEEVSTPADVAARVVDAKDADRRSVLLYLQSAHGDRRFVPLSIN